MAKKPAKQTPGVYLCVDRDNWTGGKQLSIELVSEGGGGFGFRIAGPKFNGSSESLMRCRIDKRAADEIRSFLDKVTE